jgi:hypothetical protein
MIEQEINQRKETENKILRNLEEKTEQIRLKTTLETSGKDVKTTLETSGEDVKIHSFRV